MIEKIFDKKTSNEVKNYCIKEIANKFSNTKIPIKKMVIDDKEISRNNSYCVQYTCDTCSLSSIITLNLYMRKINKSGCQNCRNYQEEKILKQTETLRKTLEEGKQEITLQDKIDKSLQDWNNEDEEFKEKYNLKYITNEEFECIKHKIISVNNGANILNNDWKYMYNFRINNQTKYNPMIINLKENIVCPIHYVKFECENCGEHFINRDLYIQKNRIKIMCKNCTFCNKTYKVKTLKVFNETVKYNSNYEKRFILWCKEKGVHIKNGPVIKDGEHKYFVDFQIGDMVIEFKDNHHYHKKNVLEGKFKAKNDATYEWCKNNNYTFEIVFPTNLNKLKEKISIRYSLTLHESVRSQG
jgi:predicted RNA-binding Zn-ribbon protein involved in translation (DUF1610 family)/predicted transcriptional regulator